MVFTRFTRSEKPDPRIHAYREDLADHALKGQVSARYWAKGAPYRVIAATSPLLAEPNSAARAVSELRFGENVTLFEKDGDWAWVQNAEDRYVGYLRYADLSLCPKPEDSPPTHRIGALLSPLFSAPDLKSPVLMRLPLQAAVRVTREEGDYAHIEGIKGGGWLYKKHLIAPDYIQPDHVTTALRLMEVPYIWGGRTPMGIDCSGLVQLSLNRAGLDCPRDSDMQLKEVGQVITEDAKADPYRRGDLVFMPGHVGLMVDEKHLLHANAHHMKVILEPLADVLARLPEADKAKTLRKRLPSPTQKPTSEIEPPPNP